MMTVLMMTVLMMTVLLMTVLMMTVLMMTVLMMTVLMMAVLMMTVLMMTVVRNETNNACFFHELQSNVLLRNTLSRSALFFFLCTMGLSMGGTCFTPVGCHSPKPP